MRNAVGMMKGMWIIQKGTTNVFSPLELPNSRTIYFEGTMTTFYIAHVYSLLHSSEVCYFRLKQKRECINSYLPIFANEAS